MQKSNFPIAITPIVREAVFEEWGNLCAYCRQREPEHVDHIIPQAKGGEDSLENYAAACEICNLHKSDMLIGGGWLQIILQKAQRKAPKIHKRIIKKSPKKLKKQALQEILARDRFLRAGADKTRYPDFIHQAEEETESLTLSQIKSLISSENNSSQESNPHAKMPPFKSKPECAHRKTHNKDHPALDLSALGVSDRFKIPTEISDGCILMPRNSIWSWRLLYIMLSVLQEDPESASGKTIVIHFSDLMAAFGSPGLRNYKPIREGIADLKGAIIHTTDGRAIHIHLSHEVQGYAWEFYAGEDLFNLFRSITTFTRVDFREISMLRTSMDMTLHLKIKSLMKMRHPKTTIEMNALSPILHGKKVESGQLTRAIRKSLSNVATALNTDIAYEFYNSKGSRKTEGVHISL